MRSVFLSPHNDDETLFGSFILLRYKPHVIICLRSQVQEARGYGITYNQREGETSKAMSVLGRPWTQWTFSDLDPPWVDIERRIWDIEADAIFAPFPEGHEHHVMIGELAEKHHGKKVRFYATYTADGKSTAVGSQVEVEGDWAARKIRALACYVSQASHETCREHFIRDQHEYVT